MKLNKYQKVIVGLNETGSQIESIIDVYDVLSAFNVTNPAYQHALKKMLCPGQRGVKPEAQDIEEAIQSLHRGLKL